MANLSFTTAQIDEALRLVIQPGRLTLQLPEGSAPIVTSVPATGTEYKISGAAQLSLEHAVDFAFDGGNDRFYFNRVGAVAVPFRVMLTQSFSQNAASAEVTVRLRVNGTAVNGIYAKRTVGNANTVGVIAVQGHLPLSENDYLELVVESTKTGDFNAWGFQADLREDYP